MNIEKKENGFSIPDLDLDFTFGDGSPEILCETQCHISTQKGMTFFDTSISIEGQFFEMIEGWIAELYN
jgi:hypothetical protein